MDDQSKYHDPEWIDDYLLDRLSESQKQEFEAAVENDPELEKKVEEAEALKEGIEALGRAEQKERLRTLEEELTEENRENRKHNALWWTGRIAAAILLLLVPLYFIVNSIQNNDPKKIYATHFEPYPVLESGVVRGEENNTTMTEGLDAYQRANYEVAIEELSSAVDEVENPWSAQFYLALSHLGSDTPKDAIPLLEELSVEEDFKLKEQAKWYLGLAFLKDDQTNKARDVFQSLYETAKDSTLRLKAEGVLKAL
ncbi:hypothetical protein [Halocola ammonii]